MKCERCNINESTIHYTQNFNGDVKEYNYCQSCVIELKEIVENKHSDNIFDLFGEFLNTNYSNSGINFNYIDRENQNLEETFCPVCKITYGEIVKNGRVGCANCYKFFSDELMPSIQRIHGNTKHIGKISTNASIDLKKSNQIAEYKQLLNQAVFNEEYEKAAQIKKEIIELEEGNQIE